MARRFPIGLTIASAIAFAILVGLGVWQVQRLTWKSELLKQVAAARAAPVRPLAEALASLLGDATLRARLREAGLARAATFSWARTATETLAVYRDARQDPGCGPAA